MAHPGQTPSAPQRFKITIPSNAGTGSTILDLLVAAGFTSGNGPSITAVIISKKQPNSATDRAAFVIASPRGGSPITATDFTDHGECVPAGERHYLPSDKDVNSYVRSLDGNPVPAIATVLI